MKRISELSSQPSQQKHFEVQIWRFYEIHGWIIKYGVSHKVAAYSTEAFLFPQCSPEQALVVIETMLADYEKKKIADGCIYQRNLLSWMYI